MSKTATKERMTEEQILLAIKNEFQPLNNNCWVRLGDPALYDDSAVLAWLKARKLLRTANVAYATRQPMI